MSLDMIQVVRAYLAEARPEPTPAEALSGEMIFRDVREEPVALGRPVGPGEVVACFEETPTAETTRGRLRVLLAEGWSRG